MARIVEDQPGQRLVVQDSGFELRVDRAAGELEVTRRKLVGKPWRRSFRLERLDRISVEMDATPAMNPGVAFKLLRDALTAPAGVPTDPDRLVATLPRQLRLVITPRSVREAERPVELRFSMEDIADDDAAVELAVKLAQVAGLAYAGVFVTPKAGLTVHLATTSRPQLERLPDACSTRPSVAAAELERNGPPPFDPATFDSDHRVEIWSPGQHIVFRRPLSRVAFVLFPFALLVLAGPALYVYAQAMSRTLNSAGFLGLAALGLVFGGTAVVLILLSLPRRVDLDWRAKAISIRTWRRTRTITFETVERLQLRADKIESGGGESGTSVYYAATLVALVRCSPEEEHQRHELLSTRKTRRMDDPLRQGVPLLTDLATALGVDEEIIDYPFRQGR